MGPLPAMAGRPFRPGAPTGGHAAGAGLVPSQARVAGAPASVSHVSTLWTAAPTTPHQSWGVGVGGNDAQVVSQSSGDGPRVLDQPGWMPVA